MLANAYTQVLLFIQTFGVLALLGVIVIVGILRIVLRFLTARQRARTTRAFRDRFHTFANSSGEDMKAYERLSFLAERMADTMGRYALVDGKPPFHGHTPKAYTTVLQFIPELRMHFSDMQRGGYGLGNDGASWIFHAVDDALIQYLGALDGTAAAATRKLLNPIAWFREGVERILALPLYVLSWFSLFGAARAARAEQHRTFRAVAGVTSIVAVVFIASTLILGEQKTNAAYRSIVATVERTIDRSVKSVTDLASFVKLGTGTATPKKQK